MIIRCVIVEDEYILRRGLILGIDWKALGCEIIGEADAGDTAFDLIQRLKPDLVITDIRMPIFDGLELIKKTKQHCDCEYLIISCYDDFKYAKTAIHLGVSDYLLKPLDEAELAIAVKRICAKIENKKMQDSVAPKISVVKNSSLFAFREYVDTNSTHKQKLVSNAVEYINQNYQKNISLKDVCKALVISESYMTKLFKEQTGYTFIDYLTNSRIKKACELLCQENIKIYTVAEQVGYKDQRYFSVLFKKLVGLTPNQFRNNQ